MVEGQTNVALMKWGASGYFSKGAVTGGCLVESAMDDLERTRCLAENLNGCEITIELFKPLKISYLGFVPYSHKDLLEAKDVIIRTSTGKEIKHTFPETRFEHHIKGLKPTWH